MIVPTRARARRGVAAALVAGAVVVAACSDDADRSVSGYCGQVQANIAAINAPTIATVDDIESTIELYRTIGDHAPAAVRPEWLVMIDSLQTAATVVAGDAASVAVANEAALSSQPAATRIQQYTKANCGTDIGTPPTPTNPVTATTLPPPTDSTSAP
jgi:hypothetical protein